MKTFSSNTPKISSYTQIQLKFIHNTKIILTHFLPTLMNDTLGMLSIRDLNSRDKTKTLKST